MPSARRHLPGRPRSAEAVTPAGSHTLRQQRPLGHLKPFLDSLFYFCHRNVFLFPRAFETLQNSRGVSHKRRDTTLLVSAPIPLAQNWEPQPPRRDRDRTSGQGPHVGTAATAAVSAGSPAAWPSRVNRRPKALYLRLKCKHLFFLYKFIRCFMFNA